MNYYIKTTNRQVFLQLLVDAGIFHEQNDIYKFINPHIGCWDEIGSIYRLNGTAMGTEYEAIEHREELVDENGIPFWHANLIIFEGKLDDIINPTIWSELSKSIMQVEPKNPSRIWM